MVRSRRARSSTGFVVSAALFLTACGGQSGDDRPSGAVFDFTPPTGAQLQEIQTLWASRDLAAKDVSVCAQAAAQAPVQPAPRGKSKPGE